MEDLSFMWTTCEESINDLKQKILSTKLELESVKCLATESQQNADMIRSLLHVAYKERDEAKKELQTVLNKINPNPASVKQLSNVFQPENPIFIPPNAKSSIIEPKSIFEACIDPQSYDSSLVDSLLDAVSSPELSNIYDSNHMTLLNQPLTKELIGTTMSSTPTGVGLDTKFDYDYYIAKGKSLPKKGKLLQAVTDASQLLNALLTTAPPLPWWRNPPNLQPLKLTITPRLQRNSYSVTEIPMTSSSNYLNSTCSEAILDCNNIPSVIPCKSSRLRSSRIYLDQQIPMCVPSDVGFNEFSAAMCNFT